MVLFLPYLVWRECIHPCRSQIWEWWESFSYSSACYIATLSPKWVNTLTITRYHITTTHINGFMSQDGVWKHHPGLMVQIEERTAETAAGLPASGRQRSMVSASSHAVGGDNIKWPYSFFWNVTLLPLFFFLLSALILLSISYYLKVLLFFKKKRTAISQLHIVNKMPTEKGSVEQSVARISLDRNVIS